MKNKNKNDGIEKEKNEGETTYSVSTTVNNQESCGNIDIEDFYDIFGDLDKHITEDSIVWVNTKKVFWKVESLKTLSVKSQRMQNI